MIATVNGKQYSFRIVFRKQKKYIVVEHLENRADGVLVVTRNDYVPLPHPAYRDDEWYPKFYEKLVLSGEIMRNKSRRKAKR